MAEDNITRLIREWQKGSSDAESALFEALYAKLHALAVNCLRSELPGRSLSATALVHEAYLRFRTSKRIEIVDRAHFLALAARVMRRILVDRARGRLAEKRAGQQIPTDPAELLIRSDHEADEIIAVDRALDLLAEEAPRQCRLVELRYFIGMSIEETAAVLGISTRTARRDWQVARTRLMGAIDGTGN
jgi:RNA polymerase sigma-70 factor, ECF subfamily